MNEKFSESVRQLLCSNFQEELARIEFRGETGEIKIVPFDGYTRSAKRFWGKLGLADETTLFHWIEIYFCGKFHRFSHYPEIEEPFVRN